MDKELVSAIERAESLAEKYGDLSDERSEALDYYRGEPFGNEVEGRSQVISRDVHDQIEAVKPVLLRMFVGGDRVVEFVPRGPEDQEQADQETDFVNYVVLEQSPGYMIFYNWLHDGLLQKNGYVRARWTEEEQVNLESYQNLTGEDLALIASDESIEIVEQSPGDLLTVDQAGMPVPTFNVKLKKREGYGCVKIENIPPESVRVSASATSVRPSECDFIRFAVRKTLSQLRSEGFDVPDDLSDAGSTDDDWEQRKEFSPFSNRDDQPVDPATREVLVREGWIRYDQDGDGVAELRHFIIVGTTILLDEEAELCEMAAWTPNIQPHQHYGESMADDAMDIQLIKSTLLRLALDNGYQSINGRFAVDAARVNLDDMLVSRPGGLVRTQGSPGDAIMPLSSAGQAPVGLDMAMYFDGVLTGRTGIQKLQPMSGQDANALNKTAFGLSVQQSAGMARTELIARSFAETGVKDLFKIVHHLLLSNSRKAETIRLRNKWVTIDPREWKTRNNLSISVGLGTGAKETQAAFLQQLLMIQMQGLPLGIATPKHIYNTVAKLTNNAGFKNPQEFVQDPTAPDAQLPPPQVPPEVQTKQMELQADQMKFQAENVKDQQKFQAEAVLSRQQAEQDAALKEREMALKMALEEKQMLMDAELEKFKAELQAQTQLQLEQMRMGLQVNVRNAEFEHDRSMKEYEVATRPPESPKEDGKAELKQAMEMMAQAVDKLSKPKRVVRGPDGRVEGVVPLE